MSSQHSQPFSPLDDARNRILQVSHVRLDTNSTAPSPLRRFEINLLVPNHPRNPQIDPQVLCGPQNETRLRLSTAASLSRQVRTVVDAIHETTHTFELGLQLLMNPAHIVVSSQSYSNYRLVSHNNQSQSPISKSTEMRSDTRTNLKILRCLNVVGSLSCQHTVPI